MRARGWLGLAATAAGVATAGTAHAARDQAADTTVVARWVQMAPGSTAGALARGSYGDAPATAGSTILARAIITGGACPAAVLDHGASLAMTPRFDAATLASVPGTAGSTNGKAGYPQYFVQNTAAANFANGTPMATTSWTECEAVIPPGHVTATIDGVDLKLPVAHPQRILVMADTGCRMNGVLSANGSNQQNCASPTAFPWAYLAQYESLFNPDLIVQIGDWFYRDTNCNGAFPGCSDPTSANYETWGDTFDSWNADVFFPARPLLAAAPWIMARGNHESCGRGARGWFALLDPYPYSAARVACGPSAPTAPVGNAATYTADFEPSYVVPAGDVNFLVHDSSFANDAAVAKATAQNYDVDLTNVLAAVGPGSMNIFATHKPSFGLTYGATGSMAMPADNSGDFTEQAVFSGGTYAASAFANGVPASIGLFMSGHIHQFEYLNFVDFAHYAPQLIVGTGGTLLDPDLNTGDVPGGFANVPAFRQTTQGVDVNRFDGSVATTVATKTFAHDEFGFAVLDAIVEGGRTVGYQADVYKVSSARAGHCVITLTPKRNIECTF